MQERHRPSPALNTALQAAASGPRSERMNQTLKIAPRLLDVYFSVTLRDANDCKIIYRLTVVFLSFLRRISQLRT